MAIVMIFFVPVEIGERNRCCNYVNSNLIDDGSVPCFIPDGMLVFDDDACYRYRVPLGTRFHPDKIRVDGRYCDLTSSIASAAGYDWQRSGTADRCDD